MLTTKGLRKSYFNPLPRKEGDMEQKSLLKEHSDFNPLPRKEGDLNYSTNGRTCQHFNPLPRKEGDFAGCIYSTVDHTFQSTPS